MVMIRGYLKYLLLGAAFIPICFITFLIDIINILLFNKYKFYYQFMEPKFFITFAKYQNFDSAYNVRDIFRIGRKRWGGPPGTCSINDERWFYIKGITKESEKEFASSQYPCYIHAPNYESDCLWCTKEMSFNSIEQYNKYMKMKTMW